ncbi:hypothetical protein [Streptomyces sp. SPB162]|uniref:hypothetical protein n=1 Tax=Streptomyces sp. SPB162 TaxID=2940560 RepID=UPI002406287E|nr:hypothetical protein [Streptomyces sp. SPB162]MDF9813021.1 hypothetical protein [Streptomyces sp. SPB162]
MTISGGETKHAVRIESRGSKAAISVDGNDLSGVVAAYTLHHQAGEAATVVLQLSSAQSTTQFDGYSRVVIGVDPDPGPAAAAFLSAIDAGELQKAALARPDLDGSPYEMTRAMLAQLAEWARGRFQVEESA